MFQSHCAQASATVLSQDQVNLSLKGAMWSFLKYRSKLAYTVLSRGQDYRFHTVIMEEP